MPALTFSPIAPRKGFRLYPAAAAHAGSFPSIPRLRSAGSPSVVLGPTMQTRKGALWEGQIPTLLSPQVLLLLHDKCGGQCGLWHPGGLPEGSGSPLCATLPAFLRLLYPQAPPGFNP